MPTGMRKAHGSTPTRPRAPTGTRTKQPTCLPHVHPPGAWHSAFACAASTTSSSWHARCFHAPHAAYATHAAQCQQTVPAVTSCPCQLRNWSVCGVGDTGARRRVGSDGWWWCGGGGGWWLAAPRLAVGGWWWQERGRVLGLSFGLASARWLTSSSEHV